MLIPLLLSCHLNSVKYRLKHQNSRRTYRVYVPSSLDGRGSVPLLVNIHGFSANASIHRHMSQMNRKADAEGFIVVYPNGTGRPRRWNAGNRLGERRNADDLGFINALIDIMLIRYPIDTSRIYVAGFSNGAMMAYRLGCQSSARIAAIAAVSGGLVLDDCQPVCPVPVVQIHSRRDPVVKYDGDIVAGIQMYPIKQTAARWGEINHCYPVPDTMISPDGRAERLRWRDDESNMEVVLWTLETYKHSWPGGRGKPAPTAAFPVRWFDATDTIWNFFSNHTKAEQGGMR